MGNYKSGMPRKKSGMLRALKLCCLFSFITMIAVTLWYNLTNGYSAMLKDEDIALIQLDEPQAGDHIVTMHTTAGDMKYKLFPEQCPMTVASFETLCKQGYYDGTYVFRVEPDIFFSGGAKNADGSLEAGAAGSNAENILREMSPKLWPLRGALCALTTRAEDGFFRQLTGTPEYYTGSRFLVCDTIEMTEEIKSGLSEQTGANMEKVADAFLELGGIPNYAQQVAVFGQLIEGFDVLDAITGAKLVGEEHQMKPEQDIIITSMELGTVE